MKKIITLIIIIIAIIIGLLLFFCVQNNNKIDKINSLDRQLIDNNENTENNSKSLVVYYSRSGNTDKIAKYISEKLEADIVRLDTVKTYPSDYDEMLDVAEEEQRNGELPELKTTINNLQDYDTIFLGYPIWWGNIASPVLTFLNNYDLSNKNIAPFVTSGSSGLSGTPNDIKELEPQANILDALSITSSTLNNYENLTNNWLVDLGYLEK